MSYKGVKIFTDKTFEDVDLDYNDFVTIDGNGTRARYISDSPYIIYEQYGVPRTKDNYNKIASKMLRSRVFGTVIMINETVVEVENEDYVEAEYDPETGECECEEQGDAYITTRLSLDLYEFMYICQSYGIRI